jgi:heptosyltransferase-1
MEAQENAPDISSERSANIRRLLIVRLSAMGDVLHALPAVAALREAFPNATLGWVIEERWAELLCSPDTGCRGPRSAERPLVDTIHRVNTRAWRRALFSGTTWRGFRASVQALRLAHYDVAVDFQGAVRSAVLASLSAAREIYGFAQPRENAASMFYTRQVQAAGAHIVEQNFSLARAIARRELPSSAVELPRSLAAEKSVAAKVNGLAHASYAVLNPGAGWGAKQWPAERYGEVARKLAEATGLQCLVNFGPGEEALARTAEEASQRTAKGITTNISELIALMRGAQLFVGGDTGPMHLAALLRVPVVAIFGPTDPARNGPFGTRNIVLRSQISVTSHRRRSDPEEGILQITAEAVVKAAVQLLEKNHV